MSMGENKMNKCYQFAKTIWTHAGYKRKDVSVVSCCVDWFVETPKSKQEKSAHCKWCAIAEVIANE